MPLIEPSPRKLSIDVQVYAVDPQRPWVEPRDVLTGLGLILALLGIYIAHSLSRSREKEKAVFDTYRGLGKELDSLKEAATKRWNYLDRATFDLAVAETRWRLQLIGASMELLRRLSKRRVSRLGVPPWRHVEIVSTAAVKELRDSITADPFDDPAIREKIDAKYEIEGAIGSFNTTIASLVGVWIDSK